MATCCAPDLYEDVSKEPPGRTDTKPCPARKVWLHRFKSKFEMKNVKVTGKAASAHGEAAAAFPAELKPIRFSAKQVFNCRETELFWKRMLNTSYIHESAKEAPGRRTWKDR